eukprot:TRINITY_DN24926_c0_g1_i1.p1 TRINITY_DN24926_c0_g1~~TRINITY_DN24926_c0_g1_i1.p1  ORF type:complete len:171 (+),score=33.00 TRINITY_DN24926_c0_g1_i1:84-596(+)
MGAAARKAITPPQPSEPFKDPATLFPDVPHLQERLRLTQPADDFWSDAPRVLQDAVRARRAQGHVLCGAGLGDSELTCGVHLFDDPKSGAPYVAPVPLATGLAMLAKDAQGLEAAESAMVLSPADAAAIGRLSVTPWLPAGCSFCRSFQLRSDATCNRTAAKEEWLNFLS